MKAPPKRHRWAAGRIVTSVVSVAAVHFAVWLSAFLAVFRAIDTGQSLPVLPELVLGFVLNLLGTPLMFLLYLPSSSSGTFASWWGDDASFVLGLAVSNSFLWGCAIAWTCRFVRRRREDRPDAL